MKHLLYVVICSLFVLSGLFSCVDDPEFGSGVHNAKEPELSKVVIIDKDKTASSVTLKSSVLKANGYPVTERGFVWNTDSVLPLKDDKDWWQPVGEGIGEYTDTIKNLTPGVKYFFWSYAINKEGPGYSPDYDSIRTNSGLGKLEVFVPKEYIRATSAIVSGKITLKGEGKTKLRGVYYSESRAMDNKKMVKSETPFEEDSFVCKLSGLKPETDYYALAFVENEISDATIITLSDTIDFTTGDGKPVVKKELDIAPGYDNVRVKSSIVNQGDAPLDGRGFCWSTTEEPTINDNIEPVGKEEGEFSANIEDLIPEQTYYIRAYGTNKFGTSYSELREFSVLKDLPTLQTLDPSSDYDAGIVYVNGLIEAHGKSDVLYKGFCFTHRVPFPDLGNTNDNERVYIRTTEDDFLYTISGLKGGTKYYIRAFATNNEGTSYGAIKEIITPDILKESSDEFRGSDRLSGSSAYFVIKDKGYLLGGDKGSSYADELWSFNPVTQSWQDLSLYPEVAKGQAVVVYGINAYALGGVTPEKVLLDDFRRYRSSPTINNWDDRTKGPDAAYSRVGVILEDIAWYIGGVGSTLKKEVWNYHFTSDTWVQKPDFPVEQFGGIALNIDGQIYAGLGKDISETCNNTLWKLNGDLSGWTQETNNNLISGGVLAGAAYNNKIYLIDDSFYMHEYDIQSKTWTRKLRINGSDRDVHSMFVINEKIYIGLINNKMYQYNPLWDNAD